MEQVSIHQCECEICKERQSPGMMSNHRLMNLFMSRLDEQERRWYAAVEATKLGHGGLEAMAQITGLHVNTIRRGQEELTNELAGRPSEGVRVKGGGRPTVEKKVLKSQVSSKISSVMKRLVYRPAPVNGSEKA